MKSSVWGSKKKIDEILQKLAPDLVKSPVVEPEDGLEHKKSKKKRRKKEHYMLNVNGVRLRCMAPGCRNRLKASPRNICCSKECSELLRLWCVATLEALKPGYNALDYPIWARTKQNKLRMRSKMLEAHAEEDIASKTPKIMKVGGKKVLKIVKPSKTVEEAHEIG